MELATQHHAESCRSARAAHVPSAFRGGHGDEAIHSELIEDHSSFSAYEPLTIRSRKGVPANLTADLSAASDLHVQASLLLEGSKL